MEGREKPAWMSEEEFAEAKNLWEATRQARDEELWRMCCSVASKKDDELLGQNEFEMRAALHRVGAKTLEAAINERRKKGGT